MKNIILITSLLYFTSCATYKTHYPKENTNWKTIVKNDTLSPIYSVYLIGDVGYIEDSLTNNLTNIVEKDLENESKQSAVIFLGDNIYPNGMPEKNRRKSEKIIDTQINVVKNYKGKTIFIPGNHDWRGGINGLKRESEYIEKKLKNKHVFYPKNGCPLKRIKINSEVEIIVVDSQWYLKNWDKDTNQNDNCDIKSREKFFAEFTSYIKKSRGKTTIVAVHHPMFSNGSHGGYFSFKQQIKPLPLLGTLTGLVRKTGGVSPQDIQSKRYTEFVKRITTISQINPKVIFASGHEHNLQYIDRKNTKQIISGSGAKISAVKKTKHDFSYPQKGFSKINIYKDGSSKVFFYGINKKQSKLVFATSLYNADKQGNYSTNYKPFPDFVKSSIYTDKETSKSKFYKLLWGKRYRKYYSVLVNAPTVNLDTLFGGLTPVRKGGGNQSVSLVLKNSDGKEYVMRAMKKNASQFLQAVVFKNQYIGDELDNTKPRQLMSDIFTGSHPYAPFTIARLSEAVNLYHTNPVLYYIPKQSALKNYNKTYGDALYMIEERASSGHGDLASFGYSNQLISTDDMLKKLQNKTNYKLDKPTYIRARLFDFLIGDWDRHQDQWRWATFKEKEGITMFKPVPRDRDQAFSVMDDGVLLGFATSLIPSLGILQSYDVKLRNIKWYNLEPYPLDMALINGTDKSVWDSQVDFIQKNITEKVVDEAFQFFPNEVQDQTVKDIKTKLLGRLKNLKKISDSYYATIHKNIVIVGTNKRDSIKVRRLPNGETKITASTFDNTVFFDKIVDAKITKEIVIYGLDHKDYFSISGKGDHIIPVQLIGGLDDDSYNIKKGNKVMIIDYASKKNTFLTKKGKKKLNDSYENNTYHYVKSLYNTSQFFPTIGSNKDDGFKIGLKYTFVNNGFHQNHFVQEQSLKVNYFSATNGYELNYNGIFNKVAGDFNLHLNADFTSPNYSLNFFGYGNKTANFDAVYGDDYNRVKIKTFRFSPSLVKTWYSGGNIQFKATYENLEVEKTNQRYISTIGVVPNNVFNTQQYVGADAIFKFENTDNKSFPTLGLNTSLQVGVKNNIDTNKNFSYIIPSFAFDYKINAEGTLVFASKLKAHINFNDNYEFYHAATIGAIDGIRGYRNQRFSGKSSFYHNMDLRYKFPKLSTSFMPLNIGIFVGYDYGRVWIKNDTSSKWHNAYGGGLILTIADMVGLKTGLFTSNEDLLFSFGFKVGL